MNAHRTASVEQLTVEQVTQELLARGLCMGQQFVARFRDELRPPDVKEVEFGQWVIQRDGKPFLYCHDEVQCAIYLVRFESGMFVGVPEKPVTIDNPMVEVQQRHRSNLLFLTLRGYLAGEPK